LWPNTAVQPARTGKPRAVFGLRNGKPCRSRIGLRGYAQRPSRNRPWQPEAGRKGKEKGPLAAAPLVA